MVGREKERQLLVNLADSGEAEFVVVYGRRRVGKTYLVQETFGGEFFFSYTGIANVNAKKQREEFAKALLAHGWQAERQAHLKDWFEAFAALRSLIQASDKKGQILIFIDEMPWMDDHKSDFVPALEHFWNMWASKQGNIMLLACGSSASWITKKLFYNKGGLYNRVTRQIRLTPFTLAECRDYYASRGVLMNVHDLIESYMIFGGIPYYMRMVDKRYSLALNVDMLCFSENAPLKSEFDRLFASLFSDSEKHMQIIEALWTKKKGLTREAIASLIDFGNGGNLTRILFELEECDFIRKYKPYGQSKNSALYRLCDPFTAFHLQFIRKTASANYWSASIDSAKHRAWSGYAFEQVCLAHVMQIKASLGISGVLSDVSSWCYRSRDGGGGDGAGLSAESGESSGKNDKGAQIDLVIDRNDGIINLCEMKYYGGLFEIDKAYDLALREKVETFRRVTKTRKALHLTMVTTYGIKRNKHSGVVHSELVMENLLQPQA